MAGQRIVLLLLGGTRSGKTSFANCVAKPVDDIPDCGSTTACKEYKTDDGRFLIIDTPGLDDSPAGNLAVLYKIAEKLGTLPEVHGVIYFHRITNTKLTGSARSNIKIFRQICGTAFLPRTVFVTTMWNTVKSEARTRFEKLELELRGKISELVDKSTNYFKFYSNDARTGTAVLTYFENLPKVGKTLEQPQLVKEVMSFGASPSAIRRTVVGRQIVKDMNHGLCPFL